MATLSGNFKLLFARLKFDSVISTATGQWPTAIVHVIFLRMMSSSVHVKLPNSPTDLKLQIANCSQSDISDVTALIKQILKVQFCMVLISQ